MIKDYLKDYDIDLDEIEIFISTFDNEEEAENFLKNKMRLEDARNVFFDLYVYIKSEYNCGNKSLKKLLTIMEEELQSNMIIDEKVLESYTYYFPCNFEPCFLLNDKTKCFVMDDKKIIGD